MGYVNPKGVRRDSFAKRPDNDSVIRSPIRTARDGTA